MRLSINMKFWHDGQEDSTRVRNVNFAWKELKKLNSFLLENGINSFVKLYDFSPEKVIDEAIHISYPLGVYKKAEKTNIILKENANSDFFMMIDCDAFFDKSDYNNFLNLIKSLEKGNVITFDLAKLDHTLIDQYLANDEFILDKADWSYAYSGNRKNGPFGNGHVGGLGGVYICDTYLLLDIGGFNEKYVGWGGEDGDMMDRIFSYNGVKKIKPTSNFAAFHLPHFSDYNSKLYSQRFEE